MKQQQASLNTVLQHPGIWRGRGISRTPGLVPTGFRALDPLLPDGWPKGRLTEVLVPHPGVGELRLVMPALARLSQQGRWLAWVAPPHIPYAPALAEHGVDLAKVLVVRPRPGTDSLWAIEQALQSGTCGAVLAWLQEADFGSVRRLQLAAAKGDSWGLLFRPYQAAASPSPAALRLRLEPTPYGTSVTPLKYQGGGIPPLQVDLDHAVVGSVSAPSVVTSGLA